MVPRKTIKIPRGVRTKKDLIDYSFDNKLINKKQYTTMLSHAKHHTIKHLSYMINKMKNGSTFTESHKLAQLRVGA